MESTNGVYFSEGGGSTLSHAKVIAVHSLELHLVIQHLSGVYVCVCACVSVCVCVCVCVCIWHRER